MKLQFSLATLLVWLTMLCASVAQADLIYLSQLRTITETATIARAVPDVKTQTFSAPDFGPFDYSGFYFGNAVFPGNSAAQLIGSYRSTLTSGELFAAAKVRAAATADSPQKNQYGVAEGSIRAVIQFTTTSAEPGTISGAIGGYALVGGILGDDRFSGSASLVGDGVSYHWEVPAGMTGTAFGQQFTPKAGAIYTLTITGDISTDGIMPLRFAYPAVWPVEASWNVTLTQGVPEPSTLMLAALGVLVAMALRRRRAGILVFP